MYKNFAQTDHINARASISLPPLKALVASLTVIGLFSPALTSAQVTSSQLPTGGNVVAGTATITQSSAVMTINQTTTRAAIDWATFNVGSAAQVNFNQPSSSSVTLNRVLDSNPSQIFGRITAPGQVFLTNPNGVFFAPGSSVDVGGLVATTHRIGVDDFMAGRTTFERNGATGSVINEGELKAALGGYIALLAPEVRNEGVIIAEAGTVVLASGEAITLNFADNGTLAGITATQSQIAALVENKNAVLAPGGLIILSAQAMSRLQGGVINNSGRLEATGLVNDGGRILLDASDSISHTGSINVDAAPGKVGAGGTAILLASLANPDSRTDVSGSISARGGDLGGDGGFIETSASNVRILDGAQITTAAANGRTGTWLIDPLDFTVTATGGNITGAALGTLLASNSIQIETATAPTGTATNLVGTTGTNGDIHVNDAVSWNANTTLTLNAFRNININQTITAGGATGKVALLYGQGAVAAGNTATYSFGLTSAGFAGKINLQAGQNFDTKLGSDGATTNWTVITALGSAGDQLSALPVSQGTLATNSLQGLDFRGTLISETIDAYGDTVRVYDTDGRLAGNFVLGANIDASATSGWNTGEGFKSIGSSIEFTGKFDGLGHTVSNLTISDSNNPAGLFGTIDTGSVIRNVGVLMGTGTITGGGYGTGALVGEVQSGTISNSYSTGNITDDDFGSKVGGLVGYFSDGTISNSFSAATVKGINQIGGLVGYLNNGTISDSYATGNLNNPLGYARGGLVGEASGGSIVRSYATGNVTGDGDVGGLVGDNSAAISNSYYAGGVVTGSSDGVGGLVGTMDYATITNSYATGAVSGAGAVGGLVGEANTDTIISNSYAASSVSGSGTAIGGLVGGAYNTVTISNSFATGSVGGTGSEKGGLLGYGRSYAEFTPTNTITISNSFATSAVSGGTDLGGLMGLAYNVDPPNSFVFTNSFWDTQTTSQATSAGGAGKTTAEMQSQALYESMGWTVQVSTGVASGSPVLSFPVGGGTPSLVINLQPTATTGSTSTSTTTTPVVIPPVAPTPPPPPVDGADTNLTSQLGAGGVSVSLESTGGAGGPGNQGANTQVDIVAVTVPKAMATTGTGFSFDLPAQVRATLGTGAVQVTLADGRPLPDWIRFNPATQRFEASAVPDGGLPLRVLIRAGAKEVMVVISERAE